MLCKSQLADRSKSLPAGAPWNTEAEFAAIAAYFQPPSEDEHFNVVRHERAADRWGMKGRPSRFAPESQASWHGPFPSLQQIQNQRITVRQPVGVSSGPLSAVRPCAVRPSAPRQPGSRRSSSAGQARLVSHRFPSLLQVFH
jgi:hypothetical protein